MRRLVKEGALRKSSRSYVGHALFEVQHVMRVEKALGYVVFPAPNFQAIETEWWKVGGTFDIVKERVLSLAQQSIKLEQDIKDQAIAFRNDYQRHQTQLVRLFENQVTLEGERRQLEMLLKRAEDAVKTGDILLASASDVDRMREKLFTPEFIDREIKRIMKVQRQQRHTRRNWMAPKPYSKTQKANGEVPPSAS